MSSSLLNKQDFKELDFKEQFDFLSALENQWLTSLPKHSEQDWIKIFPEATALIPEKIQEWEEVRKEILEQYRIELQWIATKQYEEFTAWFIEEIVVESYLCLQVKLMEANRQLRRLRRLLSGSQPGSHDRQITVQKVEQARTMSLVDLANEFVPLRRSGKSWIGKCPFHPDKTPSWHIYSETNHYHCFGCQAHGDVIAFVQHMEKLSFAEAIKWLVEKD